MASYSNHGILDADSRVQHVIEELRKLSGKKVQGHGNTMIQCPFHKDNSPSGRVSHNTARPRSIGWFNCYACNDPMPWSRFSAALGLRPFGPPPDEMTVGETLNASSQEATNTALLSIDGTELRPDVAMTASGKKETLELTPLNDNCCRDLLGLKKPVWRGYSFAFLRSIGAKVCRVIEINRYFIYLPVNISGVTVGYIKARSVKDESGTFPSYLNKPGQWSRSKGLFMYDQSVSLMLSNNLTTLVLTEGPRDALRLYRDGIPAVSILGTQSWTRQKALLLAVSGAERIVLCMDGDSAGKEATNRILMGTEESDTENGAPPLKQLLPSVRTFRLWVYAKRDGVKEYDAGNAPESVLDDLRTLLI